MCAHSCVCACVCTRACNDMMKYIDLRMRNTVNTRDNKYIHGFCKLRDVVPHSAPGISVSPTWTPERIVTWLARVPPQAPLSDLMYVARSRVYSPRVFRVLDRIRSPVLARAEEAMSMLAPVWDATTRTQSNR